MLVLVIFSMLFSGVTTLIHDVSIIRTSASIDAQTLLYAKPWSRMGAYFVGGIFGLSYFEFSSREKHYELGYTFFTKIYSKLKESNIIPIVF